VAQVSQIDTSLLVRSCRQGRRQLPAEQLIAGAHRQSRHHAPMPGYVLSQCRFGKWPTRFYSEQALLISVSLLMGFMMCRAGIVNFGLQAMLFTFLLYALLAAETDPLSYTIKVLVNTVSDLMP